MITIERKTLEREKVENEKAERQKAEREAERRHEFELREFQAKRESEKAEAERQAKREKAERESAFELGKLEMEIASGRGGNSPEISSTVKDKDLLKLITRYDPCHDIGVYLTLFERQISRIEVPKENWVTYLLELLPLDIVNVVAREPDLLADDYDRIRKLLLGRFKLSPEQFRKNFVSHRKEPFASWRHFAFELNSFFEEWVTSLDVTEYEDLKELMVVDQLKRKLPSSVREHFVDDMPKWKKINEAVNKLDQYEAARHHLKGETIRDSKVMDQKEKKRFAKGFDKTQ